MEANGDIAMLNEMQFKERFNVEYLSSMRVRLTNQLSSFVASFSWLHFQVANLELLGRLCGGKRLHMHLDACKVPADQPVATWFEEDRTMHQRYAACVLSYTVASTMARNHIGTLTIAHLL